MAITNAERESGVLRTGTALNIGTGELTLEANTVYRVVVKNLNTGKEISSASLLSDMQGKIEPTTVAHDLGEGDGVEERHTMSVRIENEGTGILEEEAMVPLTPHVPYFEGHGFRVDEIQPPHVYAADAAGTPQNAFVVGGAPDPGEIGPPIHVAGHGFPKQVTKVDLYIVKDAEVWRNEQMPQPGDSSYVAGPVVGEVTDGTLQLTAISWQPEGKDVGIYDVLVDVDRNGSFDYSFSAKDGADGEGKVGFTVQYGAAWMRTKMAMMSKHLLVNLAFSSSSRNGTWKNTYSRSETVYSYVNPPVQSGSRHGFVAKLVLKHQDWNDFWNNPDKLQKGGKGSNGRIYVGDIVAQDIGAKTQNGCTNSPPAAALNPGALPAPNGQQQTFTFDIVFDYGKDGYYDIGIDFLDVVSIRTDGSLLTSKDLENVPNDQIYGFKVIE